MTGQVVFKHGLQDWPLLDQLILSWIALHPLSDKAKFAVRLVLSEAIANAIKHGNKGEDGKHVWLSWSLNYPILDLAIRDEGVGFDFEEVSDPTQVHLLHQEGGRGVFLLKQYCVEVQYERLNQTLHCQLNLAI